MSDDDPNQAGGYSYGGVPDVPILNSQPNVQPNANPIPQYKNPQYGTPFPPSGHPFSMQGPPQTTFFPLASASSGPSAFYQSQQNGYMNDPINTYFSPSTVSTPLVGFPAERTLQPANPYIGQHFPTSGLNPVFNQTHARTDTPRNPNKRAAHCMDNSSPSLTPETHKRSRPQGEFYGVSEPQPLQLGSHTSTRSGNNIHEESSRNNSIYVDTGLTIPSRISINPIPTSIRDMSFHYRPIRANEFRLVHLLPKTMSMIKCVIIHASLEAVPRYTAVSYTWGDVEPNMEIKVNGCPFYITPNLHGALNTLRRKNEIVTLWIDALCINQRDKAEQSEQVALMTAIYGRAESVAAWLGPESDGSAFAFKLIRQISYSYQLGQVSNIIADGQWRCHFAAVVNLFERDFWNRLWIVQEIINAQNVFVYCGSSDVTVPWRVFQDISEIFKQHEEDIRYHFPQGITKGSRLGLSYAYTLCRKGPASLHVLWPREDKGFEALLPVLRICREKLAAEPRDKVFGILGILPEIVRHELRPNYNASIREVYTNVVDLILHTTRRVDIICDAVYYPVHTSTVKLPTWVPDWSFIPLTAALGSSYEFSAASDEEAIFEFIDQQQRTKLKVTAIDIDVLEVRGNAIGTFCVLDDFLMAFLHWQAKPFARLVANEADPEIRKQKDEAFCRTLALNKVSRTTEKSTWMETCYHVFASLIHERLPSIILNDHLKTFTNPIEGVPYTDRRRILYDNCASKMQGRCFFITKNGLMGMGSGFMNAGDIICVPLGCKTPIILRLEGSNEYRLVGDAYIDGYMNGEAVKEWKQGKRERNEYILH